MKTKAQLLEEIPRFFADKNRGLSIKMFAELCGISKEHFKDVFIYKREPLTEYIQRRVNKAYAQVLAGEIRVMQKGSYRYMEYRETPKPSMVRRTILAFDGNGFRLDVGIRPRAMDYQRNNLDDQLRRK